MPAVLLVENDAQKGLLKEGESYVGILVEPPIDIPTLNATTNLEKLQETATLRRSKPIINRNLSALRRDTVEETTEALVKHMEDVQQFLDFLYERKMRAVTTDEEGFPKHGEHCQALDGQYLHLTSTGFESILPVQHGLGRIPQGFIGIWHEATVRVILRRDDTDNIPAATKKIVHFVHSGAEGDRAIGVIY